MRLGLVQRGNYKSTDYPDLTGYRLEVNGFLYDFGEIITETRRRIPSLWGFECPAGMLEKRLHFSEQRFFNRMLKSEQYGIFQRHSGAHVCLGLVSQEETYNLVTHEIAHEIHYRQGGYNSADEIVQEALAIMAEEEFGARDFDWNPHYTSQQLLHQLKEFPAFGQLGFEERWQILSKISNTQQFSYLINRYLDEAEGGLLRGWLNRRVATEDHARVVLNALASASEGYAVFNRRLIINRLVHQFDGWSPMSGGEIDTLARSFYRLKDLDRKYPQESLGNLAEVAFAL